MLKNMDPEMIALLREAIQQEMGSAIFADTEDPAELFSEFLERCAEGDFEDDEKDELLADLGEGLTELRLSSNGGDPEARESMRAIYGLLEEAIGKRGLRSTDLMLIAQLFNDAGWDVPDRLKQAVVAALEFELPSERGGGEGDILSLVTELVGQVGQNPFDAYEHVNSVMAGFPREAAVLMLSKLVTAQSPLVNQLVAGFLLHPDAALAQSAAEALVKAAEQTQVESSLLERLVMMRPWLAPDRQTHLDAAIKAMRLNAAPPVKPDVPKLIKCYLSVSDGSGARSFAATQKLGSRSQLVSVLMKSEGVVDVLALRDLTKTALDDMMAHMKSATPLYETDLAGAVRMLSLALSDNLASKKPPPFQLVEVIESLSVGLVQPSSASPEEVIRSLLAELPPEKTDAAATAKAHAEVSEEQYLDQWFEAGEALEKLLHSVKGTKQRIAKVLKAYLPERRQFWARQCAFTALALLGEKKAKEPRWVQLALVGRDIASGLPLDEIPLMQQIAKVSVQVFEARS